MNRRIGKCVLVGLSFLTPGVPMAAHAIASGSALAGQSTLADQGLQCVPYARQLSGIQIYGDAHTWWNQAAGRYQRGTVPRKGAVLALSPYSKMMLGHVAYVSAIKDSRTIVLRHANWSPINGRRGQIEDYVEAVDVSDDNDWSAVRVWFAPIGALGTTHWPVAGFIYPRRIDTVPARQSPRLASRSGDVPRQMSRLRPSSREPDPIGDIIARSLAMQP